MAGCLNLVRAWRIPYEKRAPRVDAPVVERSCDVRSCDVIDSMDVVGSVGTSLFCTLKLTCDKTRIKVLNTLTKRYP